MTHILYMYIFITVAVSHTSLLAQVNEHYVNLTCVTSYSSPAARIEWFVDGNPGFFLQDIIKEMYRLFQTESSFVLPLLDEMTHSVYCQASNIHSSGTIKSQRLVLNTTGKD